MKKIGVTFLYIALLVVLCEFIYWTTMDWVIFNAKALEYGLGIMYYSSAPLLALVLSFAQSRLINKIPVFLNYLILMLTNCYILFTLQHLYFDYCDENKNLSPLYTSLDVIILIVVGYLVIFKILPKMKWRGILVVAISTVLAFIDFLFLLYGYKIFYPGFW